MKILTQPFSWVGSKVRMRQRLYDIFKDIPRYLYVEPFGGSGAVFFGKAPEPSVYNDRNRLLTNFFTVIRSAEARRQIQELVDYTPPGVQFFYEFRDYCRAVMNGEDGKEYWEKLNLKDYSPEVAAAFAFFYCQNNGFGGKCLGSYGWEKAPKEQRCRQITGIYHRNAEALGEFAKKLRMTKIINDDWRNVLDYYDSPTTFFYCDPPYETITSNSYLTGWTSEDTKELVAKLGSIQGSFVLSCYDGELYEPLLEICERRNYKTGSSLCKDRAGRTERTETVYIKNNAPSLLDVRSDSDAPLLHFDERSLV